jgi:hypothetical protein
MKQLFAVIVAIIVTFAFSTPAEAGGPHTRLRKLAKRIEKKIDRATPDVVIIRLDTSRRYNRSNYRRGSSCRNTGRYSGGYAPRTMNYSWSQSECPSGTRPRSGEGGRITCIPWGSSAYLTD